jgi:hypothetical protein
MSPTSAGEDICQIRCVFSRVTPINAQFTAGNEFDRTVSRMGSIELPQSAGNTWDHAAHNVIYYRLDEGLCRSGVVISSPYKVKYKLR